MTSWRKTSGISHNVFQNVPCFDTLEKQLRFNWDITTGAAGGLDGCPSLFPARWTNPPGFDNCVAGSWVLELAAGC